MVVWLLLLDVASFESGEAVYVLGVYSTEIRAQEAKAALLAQRSHPESCSYEYLIVEQIVDEQYAPLSPTASPDDTRVIES